MSDVHLLSDPTPGLTHVTVVCGARLPELGSWDVRAVTCAACLAPLDRGPGQAARTPAHTSRGAGVTEKQWLQQVITLARQRGYLVYHTHNSQKSAPGWPDVAFAKAASPLYLVELKTTHGQLSGHQRLWIDTLRQTTGLVVEVWRPDDWDTVLEVLR